MEKSLSILNKALEELLYQLPKDYIARLKPFIKYIAGKNISAELVNEYLADMKKNGYTDKGGLLHSYKAETINGHISAIKGLIGVMLDNSPGMSQGKRTELNNWLTGLNRKRVKIAKEKKQIAEDKILSPEEIKKLLDFTGEKVSLFIEFLACTGCRVSEMIGIKLSDMSRVDTHYHITVIGKGLKERELRVAAGLINRMQAHFEGTEYLLETSNGWTYRREYIFMEIRKAGYRYLSKRIYPHMLRHSFTSEMLRMYPGDLAGISAYLGHSNPSITASMYVHGKLSFDKLNGYHSKIKGSTV